MTWIALLRGINVGGHHKVPMKQLVADLEELGLANVRTYIQSGNVLFESEDNHAQAIAGVIQARHGFTPKVVVLSAAELRAAAAASPFPKDDKAVHLYFLDARPKEPKLDKLDALKLDTEEYHLAGKVFYLHTPAGFGISKLATRAEKLLGVEATARNWRTVTKLLQMASPNALQSAQSERLCS